MKKKDNTAPVREFHANELSEGTKKSMKERIISAVVMIALVVPALILGDWIYMAIMTVVIAFACYEILGCAGKRTILLYVIYFIFVALIAYWPIFRGLLKEGSDFSKPDPYFSSIYLPILIIVVGSFLLLWLTVVYKDFSVVDASFLALMAILIGLGFQALFFLRYYPISIISSAVTTDALHFTVDNTLKPSLFLLFIIVSTILTDTGAYFVGVFFGKHKMNERISPKKTWEGFWGGIIVSFILTSVIGIAFAFSDNPVLPIADGTYVNPADASQRIPLLNVSVFDKDHWYYILIISAIIPFFATLGDFAFSSIKRYWGIKDYGKLIPGHGGVLDRLDSIFFTAIVTAIFVYMVNTVMTRDIMWKEIASILV